MSDKGRHNNERNEFMFTSESVGEGHPGIIVHHFVITKTSYHLGPSRHSLPNETMN